VASVRGDRKGTFAPTAREFSKKLTRSLLKGIYEKAAGDGRIPTPDAAIEKMHELIEQLSGSTDGPRASESFPTELARFDFAQLEREAHHYAVDLFYAAVRPRKGAPPLHAAYRNQLLALRAEGLSPRKIAIKLGIDSSHESVDRVRKQLRIAQGKGGKK
jgi:hypothetical protein